MVHSEKPIFRDGAGNHPITQEIEQGKKTDTLKRPLTAF
jgi:hypothetical protein